jgi:hypothetical protein
VICSWNPNRESTRKKGSRKIFEMRVNSSVASEFGVKLDEFSLAPQRLIFFTAAMTQYERIAHREVALPLRDQRRLRISGVLTASFPVTLAGVVLTI